MNINHKKRIVIIDDDEVFSQIIALELKKNGYEIFLISNAADAIEFIKEKKDVDLYIIDFHLDDDVADGLTLCRKVKAYAQNPVIMLTGETSTDITVSCLYAGADQYIVKPYVLEELLARIHVVIERSQTVSINDGAQSKLMFKSVTLSGMRREIEGNDTFVRLSERELQLAEIFFTQPGIDIPRSQIFLRLFGKQPPTFSRAVDIIVGRLRKKIGQVSDEVFILSSRNCGYRLVCKNEFTDQG